MSGRKPKAKAGPKSEAQSTTRGRFGGSAARSHGEDKPNARLKEKRAQRPAGAALRARPRLASMTRLLAFIATLLLGAAASAHVPRVAANFAPTIEYATAVETHAQSAPCAAKTARPARAKIAAQESACASALTHCRVWRNPTSSQNRTSSRGVYAYTAFGENDPAGTSGNTTGTTENNYRYTGEQLDPNLGFYYLRARYMDPRVGRFLGMDRWIGNVFVPDTLHPFAYVASNPISHIDPTGLYTSGFGRRVHEYVCDEYVKFVPTHLVGCNDYRLVYGFGGDYLKPDIVDLTKRYYGEVKPLSPGGITAGIAKIALDDLVFEKWGWSRLWFWHPLDTVIDDTAVYFMNIDGVIFYTDDDDERNALQGAVLSNLRSKYRQYHMSQRSMAYQPSPMGIDSAIARVVYRGAGIAMRLSSLQMSQRMIVSPLARF